MCVWFILIVQPLVSMANPTLVNRRSMAVIHGSGSMTFLNLGTMVDTGSPSEYYTLPETNSSNLKTDSWKMNFVLGWPVFKGYVF